MPRRSAFILALTTLFSPTLAFAVTASILPAGMCAISKDNEAGRAVIDYLTSTNSGSNEVVASFADCKELDAIQAKKAISIQHYGVVLRQLLPEQLDMNRREYVAAAAKLYGNNPILTEDALTGAREAVGNQTVITAPSAITGSSKGALAKDDTMLIFGMEQVNSVGGSTTGMTLIGGDAISVNIYAPAADRGALARAKAQIAAYIPQLIAANGNPTN